MFAYFMLGFVLASAVYSVAWIVAAATLGSKLAVADEPEEMKIQSPMDYVMEQCPVCSGKGAIPMFEEAPGEWRTPMAAWAAVASLKNWRPNWLRRAGAWLRRSLPVAAVVARAALPVLVSVTRQVWAKRPRLPQPSPVFVKRAAVGVLCACLLGLLALRISHPSSQPASAAVPTVKVSAPVRPTSVHRNPEVEKLRVVLLDLLNRVERLVIK